MHNFWQKAYNEFTGKAVRRLSASGEQIRTPSEKAFRSYTISTLLMLIAPAVMAFLLLPVEGAPPFGGFHFYSGALRCCRRGI